MPESSTSREHRLAVEIRFELAQMESMATLCAALASVPEADRRPWDSAAAAKYISDLVAGLENLCRRRLHYLSLPFPSGPDSHTRLLEGFLAIPSLGGELSNDERLMLKRYLRFRHRFIHGYGHEVNWDMVKEPLQFLPSYVSRLSNIWNAWLREIECPK